MSRKSPHELFKESFEKMCFSAVSKILIVELALILCESVFQDFATHTANHRSPYEFLDLCFISRFRCVWLRP